ncbi:MAG: tRNA (adenosine(37)-N6)-dimethylallyltransferase MiaA [Candidatus Bruticola sp.]
MKPKILAIMGPTASGKSSLSLELAKKFNGEIVSADSAQIYRKVNIGTAKPSLSEMAAIPHHLIDIRSLHESQFSLAEFKRMAAEVVEEIWQRGRLPIISGGTGLYLRGFLDGYTLIELPPDPELRDKLNNLSLEELLTQLAQLDPHTYATIDKCNKRRVSRALEVVIKTGRSFSDVSRKEPPPYDTLKLGIDIERSVLYERIDKRLNVMIEKGWLNETAQLEAEGYADDLRRLHILGYSEMLEAVCGKISLLEAVEKICFATHRYAKRQQTWLRAEPHLQKITYGTDLLAQAEALVKAWLGKDKEGSAL